MPQALFDHFRGSAGIVRRVPATGHAHDRVTGKLVEHRQGAALHAIQPEHTDLRVDRSHARDVFVAGHGVSAPHIYITAILHLEPSIFTDPIFLPRAGSYLHRH